jgi:hypothetical protein
MKYRILRIICTLIFIFSILFMLGEIYLLLIALQPRGENDDGIGSAFAFLIPFFLLFWSLIEVIIGAIVFYHRRKKDFPFVLAIIQLVIFSPKILYLFFALYVGMHFNKL